MAAAAVESSTPDFLTNPNAVLGDKNAKWRYGRAPDYSKTRTVFNETKRMNHPADSLEHAAENLVKNWEIEASFKTDLADWRTVDPESYTFAINGGPPQSAAHMLKVGTYNAIISPNEYYSPENSDFSTSHKTFKRMMPTFAWEVIEVYSPPPRVAFKWRHWGTMKNDYVGFNDKGEKVSAKAHGGPIDIEGVTIAVLDDKMRVKSLETWFDPLEMFRQIAPNGVVNKQAIAPDTLPNRQGAPEDPLADSTLAQSTPASEKGSHVEDALKKLNLEGKSLAEAAGACPFLSSQFASNSTNSAKRADSTTNGSTNGTTPSANENQATVPGGVQATDAGRTTLSDKSSSLYASPVNGDPAERIAAGQSGHYDEQKAAGTYDNVDRHLEKSAEVVHPHPKDTEQAVKPQSGDAVVAPSNSTETQRTYEEMSKVTEDEKNLIMNKE